MSLCFRSDGFEAVAVRAKQLKLLRALSKRLQDFIVIFSATSLRSTLAMLSTIVRHMIDMKSANIIKSTSRTMFTQQLTEFAPARSVRPFAFTGTKFLAYQPTTVTTQNPIAKRVTSSDVVQNITVISQRVASISISLFSSRRVAAYFQHAVVIAWTVCAAIASQSLHYLCAQFSATFIPKCVSNRLARPRKGALLYQAFFMMRLSPFTSVLPKFAGVLSISPTAPFSTMFSVLFTPATSTFSLSHIIHSTDALGFCP